MVDIPVYEGLGETLATATTNGQAIFAYTFLAFDETQVKAEFRPLSGPAIPLVLNTNYTVSGLNQPNGGAITLVGVTVVSGDEVYIYRETPIEREKDWQNEGDYKADLVNREQDEIYMIMQELKRGVGGNGDDIIEIKSGLAQEIEDRIAGDQALSDRIDMISAPAKWLAGSGEPSSSVGSVGDMYLDTSTGDVYGPRGLTIWPPSTVNITGAKGDKGDPGEDGAPGAGIAAGGTIGQMLVKTGEANYITGWQDQPTITPPFAYTTRAAVTAATIPSDVTFIRTGGYRTLGDGGDGLYKKVASQPAHLGRIQSSDGAWWELIVQTVTAMQFGAYGDGVTNDTTYVKAALDYMRNPSTTGLPGSLPRRNFRRKLDLLGRLYAISETLDIDMCYGLHLDNGALIAIGTWSSPIAVMIWASNAAAVNFDNFMITNVVLQCNQKCSGIQLNNASLYQISNVYIYGWGATGNNGSFAFQSLPAGWSSTAMLHNVIALPYTSWLDERPRTDYTGVGFKLGHNDCIITGCEIAAGYKAVQFLTGAAAIQFNDNHTWIANPGNNPGIEINGNFGITMNGNYIDSHPIWVKGAGYRSLNITNNFYLSGSPAPTGFVILESPTASFILDRIVITGNIGSGGTDKVVERYSPSGTGFSATTYNYICKDNAISQTANGNAG